MWSDRVTDNPHVVTANETIDITAWFYKEGEKKPSEYTAEDYEQVL